MATTLVAWGSTRRMPRSQRLAGPSTASGHEHDCRGLTADPLAMLAMIVPVAALLVAEADGATRSTRPALFARSPVVVARWPADSPGAERLGGRVGQRPRESVLAKARPRRVPNRS